MPATPVFEYLIDRVAELNKKLSLNNRPNYNYNEYTLLRMELIIILEKFYNMKSEYLLTLGLK